MDQPLSTTQVPAIPTAVDDGTMPDWAKAAHAAVQQASVHFHRNVCHSCMDDCEHAATDESVAGTRARMDIWDKEFEAQDRLIEELGEFRGISCHPVYGLSNFDDSDDSGGPDGPHGIRLVAGREDKLEDFLWYIYAELFRSNEPIVSDFGIQFMRYQDRLSAVVNYGMEDVGTLLKAVLEAKEFAANMDFDRDHPEEVDCDYVAPSVKEEAPIIA
jgi:hypothetical protein